MRSDANTWVCIICGKKAYDTPLCIECSQTEKDKQRAERGSVTEKQYGYIEYLLSQVSTADSSPIFASVDGWDGELDYDLQNLSTNQAGKIISDLLTLVNSKKELGEADQ